ncbi:MAG: hypothetical protein CBB71_10230 [Rhodopirellula sp. TMED11]|nr:MAG: hypothetical protein CBB71_10230 [Rhodopirellula sp. TMED11]
MLSDEGNLIGRSIGLFCFVSAANVMGSNVFSVILSGCLGQIMGIKTATGILRLDAVPEL